MARIETISPELRFLLDKVQRTSELNEFSLAGGTNLALRFDHRISTDIDLFTSKKLGVKKSKNIVDDLIHSFYQYKPDISLRNDNSDHKVWIRMNVIINENPIRFDIIQNVPFMYPTEQVKGIKMAHVLDISLMKIDSVLRRGSLKDMYDLNYITDHVITLPKLWKLYQKRQKRFKHHINTFTANQKWDPINFSDALADVRKEFNPDVLEDAVTQQNGLPSTVKAYNQWRSKVQDFCQTLKNEAI